MDANKRIKIRSLTQLYELLPEDQRVMMDVLRGMVIDALPYFAKKKYLIMYRTFMATRGFA